MNAIHSEIVLKRIKNFQQTKIQKKLKTMPEIKKLHNKLCVLFFLLFLLSGNKTAWGAPLPNETNSESFENSVIAYHTDNTNNSVIPVRQGGVSPNTDTSTAPQRTLSNPITSLTPSTDFPITKNQSAPCADTGISLSFRNASLQEVAAALTKLSGKNIVADAKIAEPVTLTLHNVSPDTALETVTAVQGLSYREQDGVILISKDDLFKKQSAGFYTFHLQYIRAEELQKTLAPILNGGKISADAGSNCLLFNGSPAEARKIGEMLQQLDIASRQITLKAKIISFERSEEKNLGLQWNWDTLPQYALTGSNESANGKSESKNAFSDHLGHLRLWNGTRAQFRFTATLNALVTSGKAKVLATPSLITLPGKEASIFIGSHIPVITEKHNNGESTYSTEYVDAGIKLTYTPIVSKDGFITSRVHTEVSTPTLISELKNYRINSRTADTNVRMRNGETLVIGGLISEEEQKQLQQIPFLSKIPLLGELFKNRYRSKSKTEVIILLTPYLSEPGKSPAIYR